MSNEMVIGSRVVSLDDKYDNQGRKVRVSKGTEGTVVRVRYVKTEIHPIVKVKFNNRVTVETLGFTLALVGNVPTETSPFFPYAPSLEN